MNLLRSNPNGATLRFGLEYRLPPPHKMSVHDMAYRLREPRIVDRKTVLSRLVDIELIGVEHKTPTEAGLRLKTTSKGGGDQTTSEEDTLPAWS